MEFFHIRFIYFAKCLSVSDRISPLVSAFLNEDDCCWTVSPGYNSLQSDPSPLEEYLTYLGRGLPWTTRTGNQKNQKWCLAGGLTSQQSTHHCLPRSVISFFCIYIFLLYIYIGTLMSVVMSSSEELSVPYQLYHPSS